MSDTPRLGMPELVDSQSGKAATVNEALRVLDALVQPSVLAVDLNDEPSGPADGDLYVVADGTDSTSGDWEGHDGHLAYYSSTAWTFMAPEIGWTVYNQDDGMAYRYQGSDGWVPIQDEHEIVAWKEAVPVNSEVIHRQIATRALIFPPNFAGSRAEGGDAATASATFVVAVDGVQKGTIIWDVSGTVATFATDGAASVPVAAGEVLTITGPADNDATLAKIAITLVAIG